MSHDMQRPAGVNPSGSGAAGANVVIELRELPMHALAYSPMKSTNALAPVTRRAFLKTGAVLTAGIATLSRAARAETNKNSKLRIFHMGVGGVAGMQRKGLKDHPMVEFAGFCDVERRELDKISKEFPNAWTIS